MQKYLKISEYFATLFPGKVRKIAIDASLGCPNRDGQAGKGGCIFCNNAAFSPRYAFGSDAGISEQLREGMEFSRHKGEVWGYLAYFQTYSNTYGDTERLVSLYEEALSYPGVKGLVLATRPDCLKDDLLEYFEERFGNKAPADHPFLLVELGMESTKDETLRLINRGHNHACSVHAAMELSSRGIATGAHIILGLPGEDGNDYISHAERISELPVSTLKLHHLQVVKGTRLAGMYAEHPDAFKLFAPEDYAAAARSFLEHLREGIAVDRLVSETPRDLIIAPKWDLKPSEFQKLFF